MKKSLHSLFIAAIVSVTVVCAQAAEAVSEAVVLKVKGGALASIPGQANPVELKVGDKLPQGTVIETPANSEVEIQVFSGSTSVIQSGSKVDLSKISLTTANGEITKQTAVIGLSLGTVVSTLDPSKKAINDYSIRTPKGVAAARGTKYTVQVAPTGQVRTFVAQGVVVFVSPTGKEVTVQSGYVVTVDDQGNISEPVEATDAQRDAARDAFKD
ncbi:MAG: hypothetical protein K0R17_3315, partial [Rariglobus sp.]|nr:hypothetical protein [Rariglobus sp.]